MTLSIGHSFDALISPNKIINHFNRRSTCIQLQQANSGATNWFSTSFICCQHWMPELILCHKSSSALRPSTGRLNICQENSCLTSDWGRMAQLSLNRRCQLENGTFSDYSGSCHYISLDNATLPCQQWEYDHSIYQSSIVSDVCEQLLVWSSLLICLSSWIFFLTNWCSGILYAIAVGWPLSLSRCIYLARLSVLWFSDPYPIGIEVFGISYRTK